MVSSLYTLADMSETIKECQQDFIRSVQNYIGIKIGQIIVLSDIENIKNLDYQKAILQTCLEFLFLENENHEYEEKYADFIDYFSVKPKGILEIQNAIDNIYRATGLKGLSEKYGYVIEESNDNAEEETQKCEFFVYDGSDICEKCADNVHIKEFVTLDNCLVYIGGEYREIIYKIEKAIGEQIKLEIPNINTQDLGLFYLIGGGNKFFIIKEGQYNRDSRIICVDINTLETKENNIPGTYISADYSKKDFLILLVGVQIEKGRAEENRFIKYDIEKTA